MGLDPTSPVITDDGTSVIAVFDKIAKRVVDKRSIATGEVVLILFTVAIVDPVLPAASTKLKVNDPFAAKAFVRAHYYL